VNESREVLESTGEQTSPIFVDTTGRRRRWLRWLGYGVGVACVGYGVVLVISLLGGPVSPDTLVPGLPKPTASKTTERVGPLPIGSLPTAVGNRSTAVTLPTSPGATRSTSTAPSGPPRTSKPRAGKPSPTANPPASTSPSPGGTSPTPGEEGGSAPAGEAEAPNG
jgi:hypothetical protein